MSRIKNLASIFAMTENGCIGKYHIDAEGNRIDELPWKHGTQKDDMKRFKELTTGNIVVMGYNTWSSFGGRPLPNRMNIVLTSKSLEDNPEKGLFFEKPDNLEQYLRDLTEANPDKKVFIIGGRNLYNQTAELITELYTTYIHRVVYCMGGVKTVSFDDAELDAMKMPLGCLRVQLFEANDRNDFAYTTADYVWLGGERTGIGACLTQDGSKTTIDKDYRYDIRNLNLVS